MLPFLPSFTQPSSLLLTTTSTHSSSILLEIISYSPTPPLHILRKGTEFLCNVVSTEVAVLASFLRFWTFIFHSLIYSLSLSFSFVPYIHFLVEIGKKGFFLSKNHLCYIIARCPLSLLIPYWGFKMYFSQGILKA